MDKVIPSSIQMMLPQHPRMVPMFWWFKLLDDDALYLRRCFVVLVFELVITKLCGCVAMNFG
jgi:hypothetical protein